MKATISDIFGRSRTIFKIATSSPLRGGGLAMLNAEWRNNVSMASISINGKRNGYPVRMENKNKDTN